MGNDEDTFDWRTPDGCVAILRALSAPPRLIRHGQLVCEAADALLALMAAQGVAVDAARVRAGAMLHDAGKAVHVEELDVPGNRHEPAGRAALLKLGLPDAVARFCETHAAWDAAGLSLEDLLVALADKLWKGARVAELEGLVIDRVAAATRADRWSSFIELDDAFERIAGAATSSTAKITGQLHGPDD